MKRALRQMFWEAVIYMVILFFVVAVSIVICIVVYELRMPYWNGTDIGLMIPLVTYGIVMFGPASLKKSRRLTRKES